MEEMAVLPVPHQPQPPIPTSMTIDPTPEEKPIQADATPVDDFELPSQQEGAQSMIVCEGGCE